MAAAGLWKRQDIDRFEAAIYRKILDVANNIPNKAILNTMTSINEVSRRANHLIIEEGMGAV